MRSLNKAEGANSPEDSPESPATSPGSTVQCTQSQNAEAPHLVIPPSKQPLSSVQAAQAERATKSGLQSLSGQRSLPLFMQRGNAKGLTLKCVNLTTGQFQVNDRFIETIG